ncbi:MAG TPA: hypothetical protein DDW78_08100 [Treponema sp.]|nr:hypothetical protein [Treponema sp.]
MQALQVQFLNPQSVSPEKPEAALKPNKSSESSFKAMLEKASAGKKSDQRKPQAAYAAAAKDAEVPASPCADAGNTSPEQGSNDAATAGSAVRKAPAGDEERAEDAALPVAEYDDAEAPEIGQADAQLLSVLPDAALAEAARQSAAETYVAEAAADDTRAVEGLLAEDGTVEAAALIAPSGVMTAGLQPAAEPAVDSESALPEAEAVASLSLTEDGEMPAAAQAPLAQAKPDAKDSAAVPAKDEAKKPRVARVPVSGEPSAEPRQLFTIVDERGKDAKLAALQEDSSDALLADTVRQAGSSLDVTMNLAQVAEQDILSSNNQTAGATGSTFQEMLSNQIQQQAPEFVKAGSIILKDGNSGTINMNLKPESLGNVKISLQLTDKGIEGQITVASKEAFEAFKQNLDTLKQAFHQSGFDTASFNLNLASNADGGQFQQGQQPGGQFFANRTFGSFAQEAEGSVSASVHGAVSAYGSSSDHHVDVVA